MIDQTGAEGAHTVGRWLRERAATSPGRIAIDDRGVLIDYASLWNRSERLASVLSSAGYGAGSRLATVSGNSSDHIVAFFACALLGSTMIPLSWRLTPAELSQLIRRSAADLLLFEDEYSGLAGAALRELDHGAPQAVELGATGVETQAPSAQRPRRTRPAHDDDPLLVIYTSGSEAAPKGVVLTHSACFWNNLALSRAMPMTPDDVVLAILPQFHVAAWNVQPLLALWIGARVVLERSFQPGRVLQLIQDRGITTMMGVPTQYRLLRDSHEWGTYDLSSLRRVVVGGSTIPPQLSIDWAEAGHPLTQGYGLTEAGPNVLYIDPEDLSEHPGAVGRPYPSVETRLVDPESGLELGGVATGELQVRGPSLFAGYLDDGATTERAMIEGWLRTGDLVSRDEHGVHRVVDRIKNIYVSGGENVAPAEVELVLTQHPLVREAAVVAIPDPVWGERGVAFVVLDAPLSDDELLAFARTHLAAFKLPTRIARVEELPRTSIEKVDRVHLGKVARQWAKAPASEVSAPADTHANREEQPHGR